MLKKNYKLKILLFLALIVLVDTAFVSWKFYTNQGIMGANRIWLVLENWLISLTGDVTVSYADIMDVPGIPLVARWIYGASRFLFPLLGISFILRFDFLYDAGIISCQRLMLGEIYEQE